MRACGCEAISHAETVEPPLTCDAPTAVRTLLRRPVARPCVHARRGRVTKRSRPAAVFARVNGPWTDDDAQLGEGITIVAWCASRRVLHCYSVRHNRPRRHESRVKTLSSVWLLRLRPGRPDGKTTVLAKVVAHDNAARDIHVDGVKLDSKHLSECLPDLLGVERRGRRGK